MKTLRSKLLAFLTMGLVAMAASAQTRPVVHFIATGGTIAMKIDPVTRGVVPAISGDDLMQTVPDAAKYASIEVNNFSSMSSNYVEPKWLLWILDPANRPIVDANAASAALLFQHLLMPADRSNQFQLLALL